MNWQELKEKVENNNNILTVTMEELRNAGGAAKLGVHVVQKISKELLGIGLGHVPVDLPTAQNEQVRLFKRGTTVGELIEIVLRPGEANDRQLVERCDTDHSSYIETIEKIRELVAE
jgi:hypothetical protein